MMAEVTMKELRETAKEVIRDCGKGKSKEYKEGMRECLDWLLKKIEKEARIKEE